LKATIDLMLEEVKECLPDCDVSHDLEEGCILVSRVDYDWQDSDGCNKYDTDDIFQENHQVLCDAWNDFKDVLMVLKEKNYTILYQSGVHPDVEEPEWEISVGIPFSHL